MVQGLSGTLIYQVALSDSDSFASALVLANISESDGFNSVDVEPFVGLPAGRDLFGRARVRNEAGWSTW